MEALRGSRITSAGHRWREKDTRSGRRAVPTDKHVRLWTVLCESPVPLKPARALRLADLRGIGDGIFVALETFFPGRLYQEDNGAIGVLGVHDGCTQDICMVR
jgi:hypothetical protein